MCSDEALSLGDELAALGPFFAVEMHGRATRLAAPWQRYSRLLVDLDGRVGDVRRALANSGQCPESAIELRVAASAAHLGLVARLLAPAIGASALGMPVISWDVTDIYWQNKLGGPFPLSVTVTSAHRASLSGSAAEATTLAFEDRYSLSSRVLWGNVASAANSAASLVGMARPELALRAAAAANAILSDRRVEGGRLQAGSAFRRSSCCLIYRIAGDRAAVCGDCVLLR